MPIFNSGTPIFFGALDLAKQELRNAVVQNLSNPPGSPRAGQIYMDITAHTLYFYSGTQWVAAGGAGGGGGTARKFVANLNGTSSPEVITHSLNTRAIALAVVKTTPPFTAIVVEWEATTADTATIRYSPNLGAGFQVVVFG